MIFIKGFVLGLLIAVPVGPIGVLCIKRTLERGRLAGFVSGLGAATADAFYGAVAAFGLVFISNFLINQKFILGLIGGLVLIYIGIKSFYKKPGDILSVENEDKEPKSLLGDYLSTFLLTITNPSTIIFFTAFFASIGFGWRGSNTWHATLLVLGVFLGSTLWWLLLSLGIEYVRTKVKNFSLYMVNKISGACIIFFALMVLWDLLK
jgi:threonine/homoserine/homoserine lactone efflux protein